MVAECAGACTANARRFTEAAFVGQIRASLDNAGLDLERQNAAGVAGLTRLSRSARRRPG